MRGLVLVALVAIGGVAAAEPDEDRDEDRDAADDGLVLLNASPRLGNRGHVDRLHQILDSRGLLRELPESLQDMLEGRHVLLSKLDAIREAYTRLELDEALRLVEAEEARILRNAAGGDPIPALVQLAEWRGVIAVGREDREEAERWFRAAVQLNPAWTPDKKLVNSRARPLIKRARREARETGRLRLDIDPEDATVQIDGGKPRPVGDPITLSAGIHLVTISARRRATYAELVDIRPGKTEPLELALDEATKTDRAAKLLEAAVSATPGKARLRRARRLSRYAGGARRFLVIEDGNEEQVTVRVYDIDAKKVSRPLELDNEVSSAAIARKVVAALDPGNMIEPSKVMIVERRRDQRWYERWYVWVGLAAVAGGGVLGYQYMTREPTTIRGF